LCFVYIIAVVVKWLAMMFRRQFLGGIAASLASAKPNPTIVVRSGWQTVNIGDIAHTPGLLAALEKHIPGAQFVLWPAALDRGAEPMLKRRFPKLRIVNGVLGTNGEPDTAEVREAFQAGDLFVHGSAASVGSHLQAAAWKKLTGKPYGFFGVGFTLTGEAAGTKFSDAIRPTLNGSAFLFTRETASLTNVKKAGIQGPELGFAPDGTFSMDITDEERAKTYLNEAGLTEGKFICVVPRLRYTPYHKIRKVDWSPEEINRRDSTNEKYAEQDHSKLREAVVAYVRRTGGKALLCPEMTYQLDIIDPLLFDPLPSDVKRNVVRRKTYWLPDEAASVYKRAVAVISSECHSPILAAVQGTPCMYVHQPEDGIKGHMWKDIGLADWFFEIDQSSGADIAQRVLEIQSQGSRARQRVAGAVKFAQKTQAERIAFIRDKVLNR
jgi:polysaccharide pyruvyl transferase WcaK-like protein